MTKKIENVCGTIGICIGWLIPIAGIVLGIVALKREEKGRTRAILSIIIACIAWFFYWVFSQGGTT